MLEDLRKQLNEAQKETNTVEEGQKEVQKKFEENKKNLDAADGVAEDAKKGADELKDVSFTMIMRISEPHYYILNVKSNSLS